MSFMYVLASNASAGRQPFAQIQNLHAPTPSTTSHKPFPPSAKPGKWSQDCAPISTLLPKNANICQPQAAQEEHDSTGDEATGSYSRGNAELMNEGTLASVMSPVASETRPASLKRVRTVNKLAGLAMKERRRKGELDLPTQETLQPVAALLRKRRAAAERFYKF